LAPQFWRSLEIMRSAPDSLNLLLLFVTPIIDATSGWYLSESGANCDVTCADKPPASNYSCDLSHQSEIDTVEEFNSIMASLDDTFTSCNGYGGGYEYLHPGINANGFCALSPTSADCATDPGTWRRICYCQAPPRPPELPPRPPAPPPAAPGSRAGITGDPHLKGAHGEEADFRGEHGAKYVALSARNFSLNLLIEHNTFHTPYSKLDVHGSWVRAAFQTVRTSATSRLVHIFFHAVDPHRAIITEGCTAPYCRDGHPGHRHELRDGAAPFVAENLRVSLRHKVLTVANGQWLTTSESSVGAPHVHSLRMNVEIRPTHAVCYDAVKPHGLLGQTYDCDDKEVNGRTDDYSHLDDGSSATARRGVGGNVTTRARAEGAIEGTLDDYRVRSDFGTAFRFSRFDSSAALVRNVSALGGNIGAKHEHAHPGREAGR